MRKFGGALAAMMVLTSGAVRAELTDEIQVYTDEINQPGEFGLELHVNTTPKGRSVSAYDGEVTPHHGVRLTPEFSYGLNEHWELGAYLPIVTDADGKAYLPSVKGRVKWLPFQQKTGLEGVGWYGGLNVELANVNKKFEPVTWSSEFRFIGGYHTENWLFGFNPIFGKDWSDGTSGDAPVFELGVKITRKLAPQWRAGIEYYNDFGAVNDAVPFADQARTLYAVVDFDNEILPFNLGVGHGLTDAADAWTVKAIFEVEFH